MQHRYWTSSKFADFIRGTRKLKSGTSEAWAQWHIDAKIAHPFRYWLAEDFLMKLEDLSFWPANKLSDIKCYLRNRFVTQTHALVADKEVLKPGTFYELSDTMLPCLFGGLVDYVEISLAWMHVSFSEDKLKVYGVSWKNRMFPFSMFNPWRSAKAGREHLMWESSLVYDDSSGVYSNDELYGKPTRQAIAAKEILELYDWYKSRKFRPESIVESGWLDFYTNRRIDKALVEGLDKKAILDHMDALDKKYTDEDTEMLIRLIKIRDHLWT